MEELENNVSLPEDTQTEVNEVNTETIPEADVQTQEEPFMKVKYNKEEMELDREKAVELAQKGLNYDKVQEKLNQLENDPLQKYLKEKGFDSAKLLKEWQDEEEWQQAKVEAEKRGIIDEDLAREFYQNKKIADEVKREKETQLETQAREEKELLDLIDFLQEETDEVVDVRKIPEEIFKIAKEKGMTPVNAFIYYDRQQMKTKQTIQKRNEENALLSTGSVTNNGTNTPVTFTSDSIEKMTKEEMDKHWNNPSFRKAAGLDLLK